ncbi:MAG: thioredoxin family protein [Cyanobacteria bacterium]|nr:thioredoxin family protein [Cyanobacteriota bacterium]
MQILKPKHRFILSLLLAGLFTVGLTTQGFSAGSPSPSIAPDLPEELRGKQYVLLDFYAEWCSVCKQMEPVITDLKSKPCSGVQVVEIDVDKAINGRFNSRYQVEGVPTYILFNPQGKAIYKMDRLVSPDLLREKIKEKIKTTLPKTCQVF